MGNSKKSPAFPEERAFRHLVHTCSNHAIFQTSCALKLASVGARYSSCLDLAQDFWRFGDCVEAMRSLNWTRGIAKGSKRFEPEIIKQEMRLLF